MGKGGGGGSTTTVQKADPWIGVQPHLTAGYDLLRDLFTNSTTTKNALGLPVTSYSLADGPQYFPGQTVAGTSPYTTAGQMSQLGQLGNMMNMANLGQYGIGAMMGGAGTANQFGNMALGSGQMLQSSGGNLYRGGTPLMNSAASALGSYGGNLYNQGLGMFTGQNNQLNQLAANQQLLGGNAINETMFDIDNSGRNLTIGAGDLANIAGGGTTESGVQGMQQGMAHLLGAGNVQNNPYLNAAMEAAIRPVTQQFQESVMPGIKQGAMGAGQMGSSRQGIAEGIASRGYMDTIGDMTAQMGSQAYGQGLNAVQAGAGIGGQLMGQGLGAATSLGQLGMQGAGLQSQIGNQALDRAMAMRQGLLGAGMDISQMGLGALGQSGQFGQAMANMGLGAMGSAGQLGSGMYGQGMEATGRGTALAPGAQQMFGYPGQTMAGIGNQQQAQNQAQINADMARWNYNQQLPYSMLSDYLGILSGAPGGTTSSMSSGPSGGGNSLMSGLGGAMSGYGMGSGLATALGLSGPWGWGGAALGGALGLFG